MNCSIHVVIFPQYSVSLHDAFHVSFQSGFSQEGTEAVTFCCCVSGDVAARFEIARRGYVPGETIHVNAAIRNDSNIKVDGTHVALRQVGRIWVYCQHCIKSIFP